MSAPKEIVELTERFARNLEAYHSGDYKETQLRREFLDPFFTALGWDVENKQGYAEAYKDVIHEDAIKVGGATKAPDYCFRIGGTRKFFVEAKKPSTSLKDEISPAYQLRRYAWSAKLPLSILTDFEEFVVYDCRVRPARTDAPATARTMYIQYHEYPGRWEEIAAIFSREAVLKGSFDRYVESTKAKKGTAEVDDAFLREIEAWRDSLARTIALRNPKLSQRELNFSVQRTIDRMIFLRICEDRGIETYGALMALLNGEHVYKRLCELFHRADEKYNSGLFHFRKEKDRLEEPDELTLSLDIDDKPLKEIIRKLYYPDSPYEFSVLPADILGQVYEQFLGKVIRLTAGHRAVVEDKPEVKKAGGVYYTPTYIVDYIVKNTVGKLLLTPGPSPNRRGVSRRTSGQGEVSTAMTPKDVSKLRILDPACGSGSFLIEAYQYLLDWHRDWYVNDGSEKWATGRSPALYQVGENDWRLTTAERKRILLNNIYGVDIDPQAVEVTKLSLLLKVLEGENEQTISRQLRMFHERALPDLGSNIKCGNSLIGPDFYEGKQLSLTDDEERLRINVFDWKKEFKEIMDAGGFHAVIGNPPWVRQEFLVESKEYFAHAFEVYHGAADLYSYFLERSIKLTKRGGLFSFIVPNKWMIATYGRPLRTFFLTEVPEEIIDFGDLQVFHGATTYPCIVRVKRGDYSRETRTARITSLTNLNLDEYVSRNGYTVNLSNLSEQGWAFADAQVTFLLSKMKRRCMTLGEYVGKEVCRGIVTGFDEAFTIDVDVYARMVAREKKYANILKPYVMGRDVKRYEALPRKRFLIFTRRGIDIDRFPFIRSYLEKFKSRLMPRPRDFVGARWEGRKPGPYKWYEIQDTIDYFEQLEKPKIVYLKFQVKPAFTFDDQGFYPNSAVWALPSEDKYLLGILNSRLGWFLISNTCSRIQNGFQLIWKYVKSIPIRKIDFSDSAEKSRHDRMVQMVEQMLALHKQLASVKTEHEKTALKRQIDATDKQIDKLVYELYGMTEEEIEIVEGT